MIMVARLLTTEIRCHQGAGTFCGKNALNWIFDRRGSFL